MHNPASNAAAKPCNKASKLMQHNYAPMLHKFLQGWLRAQTNQVICTNEQSCFIAATNPVPRLPKRIQQNYDRMLIVKPHKLFAKMVGCRNKKFT